MRPVPSRLPLLWLASLIALAIATYVGWRLVSQRADSASEYVQDQYRDPHFESDLQDALEWLGDHLQPRVAAPATPEQACAEGGASQRRSPMQCALVQINATLVTTAQSVAATGPDAPPDALARPLAWLARHVHKGEQLLAMIQDPHRSSQQGGLRDPFRLDGCIAGPASAMPRGGWQGDCAGSLNASMADLLPGATALVTPVLRYVHPDRGQAPNTVHANTETGMRTPLKQGRHLELGLASDVQDSAQRTAECYTGSASACARCPWCNSAAGAAMFEGARARAMGVLVVDVHTSAIEAAGSAYTPCYEAQQRGMLDRTGCPELPRASDLPRKRESRLENLALLGQGMPGSEVKTVVALGLVRAGLSPKESATLPSILTRSATEELIDLVLCREKDFLPSCAQRRLTEIASLARSVGWQSGIEPMALGQVEEFHREYFAGRLLELPAHPGKSRALPLLDQDAMRECGNRPVRLRWRNCRGADLVDVVAELFGQGNARVSPLGIANGMLSLGAAGNGQSQSQQAHLVMRVQRADGSFTSINVSRGNLVTQRDAAPVLRGLARTHLAGTAQSACRSARIAIAKELWVIPCSESEVAISQGRETLHIASKTGTPVFSGDRKTLTAWRRNCEQFTEELKVTAAGGRRWYHLRNERAKCELPPLKWYAMLVGRPSSASWDKVVVVFAERNWNSATQMIDSLDDRGPNVAAEAGLALANALYRHGP
jgi:hypothetical protein